MQQVNDYWDEVYFEIKHAGPLEASDADELYDDAVNLDLDPLRLNEEEKQEFIDAADRVQELRRPLRLTYSIFLPTYLYLQILLTL
jgi:hypothetical protein